MKGAALPRSVVSRLLLAAALALGIALGLMVMNVGDTVDSVARSELDAQRQALIALLPDALVDSLTQTATANPAPRLDELRRASGLAWLSLLDRDGKTLASSGTAPEAAFDTQNPLHGEAPLMKERRILGYVIFAFPAAREASARRQALTHTIPLAVALFCAGLFLFHRLARWLEGHLGALREAAAQARDSTLDWRASTSSPTEIAAVALEINRLRDTLAEQVAAAKRGDTRFHAVADHTFGAEGWLSPDGHLLWVSPSVDAITGYTQAECLLHADLIDLLVYEKDKKHARQLSAIAANGGPPAQMELRFQRKDGSLVWVALHWQSVHDTDGRYLGLRLSADDIQARKEAELKLIDTVAELRREQGLKEFYLDRANQERARLAALLDAIDVGVMFVDQSRRLVYCNKLFNDALGIPEDEHLEGQNDFALMERTTSIQADPEAYRAHILQVLATREPSPPFDFAMRDGRIFTDASALVAGTQPGEVLGRIWLYRDVTEMRNNATRLEQLATRDPLTGAFNRRRFHEELERRLADALRRQISIGLLIIDLDGFKPINDEFGHQAGDVALVRLAELVSRTIRRNEMFFRLGGDEFAVLATDTEADNMEGLARRLGDMIGAMRFEFSGREISLTASQGIALFPDHASDADSLVAAADNAMYAAKNAGKNSWALAGHAAAR